GFLWFYDPQASIFTWVLIHLHLVSKSNVPNWLGSPDAAAAAIITVHAWRTILYADVIVLAGLSSILQETDDAAVMDGPRARTTSSACSSSRGGTRSRERAPPARLHVRRRRAVLDPARLPVLLDGGDVVQAGGVGVRPDEGLALPPDARELRLPAAPHRLPALGAQLVVRRADGCVDHAGGRAAGRLCARPLVGARRPLARRRHLPHVPRPADAALPAP